MKLKTVKVVPKLTAHQDSRSLYPMKKTSIASINTSITTNNTKMVEDPSKAEENIMFAFQPQGKPIAPFYRIREWEQDSGSDSDSDDDRYKRKKKAKDEEQSPNTFFYR